MRADTLVRTWGLVAVLSVGLAVWTVERTIDRAGQSNERVVHTHEVLAAVEATLEILADAEHAVRAYLSSADHRLLEALNRADRGTADALNRLAALTIDSPRDRIDALRDEAARSLLALHAVADERRVSGVVRPATLRMQRTSMDRVQRTLQPIRLAEGQALAAQAQADRAAVSRLRVSLAVAGATVVALLGWVMWLLLRDAKRAAQATEALRRANGDLEAQIRSRTADLRESSERLRSIIDSAADAIVVIDINGRIESFSRTAERLFGYPAAEVMGRNVSILMPSPYHEEHDGYLARYLAIGEPRNIGIGRQVNGRRRDGTTFPLHLSVGEMSIGGERKFTGIMHDLSARVRLEEQLREQTTLARLGEMAAVIAHEVKNPLAGIRGAIQVIGGRLPGDSKDGAMVTEIVSRIDALNELMKDLLLFARPPQPHPAAVEIDSLLAATTELLADDPAFTNVSVRVDGAAPRIFADAALLKIVFVNLLINAAHAMPQGGTIQVSIGAANGTCHIAFSDAGPGIPPSVREKIFTPFFTTKSRGTGLGLPTARRLVEAHRGTISITCPPAGGTTVLVQLPTPTVEAA